MTGGTGLREVSPPASYSKAVLAPIECKPDSAWPPLEELQGQRFHSLAG